MKILEIESSSLPNDTNVLTFNSFDQLLRLNSIQLTIQCSNPSLNLDELLGNPVVLSLVNDGGYKRFFHAYINAAEDLGQRFDKFTYSLNLSSWLWYLNQNNNSRIFQNLDVLEIISNVFAGYKFSNYKIEVDRKYDKRVYCVQFGETDYNFVSRLMEDEGLWFFIDHSVSSHTVVITNQQKFPKLTPGYRTLDFIPDSEENRIIREGVQSINRNRKLRPLGVVLRDFDYNKPSYLLHRALTDKHRDLSSKHLEWYDFGTGFATDERGDHLASIQLKAFQAEGNLLYGQANALGIRAGHSFRLSLHPDASRNKVYKIISCSYFIDVDSPDNRGRGNLVKCEFVALAYDLPFHPVRVTSKPRVYGTHSATVVGPKGSEVHTDNMSRIRVHFHWDRYKTVEEDASCWIRVSQAWAGKGWGVIAMPRVGQEVLITYVDGDLDRPLVTGIVYNGDNLPPYKLPERIRYSGIVSRSLRHGTPENASQVTMDDLRGNERVLIHAERDFQKTVERSVSTSVGNNSTTAVAQTATTTSTNSIKIENSNHTANARLAHFVSKQFSATGMSMGLNGTLYNAILFNSSASAFDTIFKGVSNARLGWADVKFGLTDARIGTFIKSVAFSQNTRATAGVYTQHSQNFNSYVFTQNQLGISVIGAEELAIESEKIQFFNFHTETKKLEAKKDASHVNHGTEKLKFLKRHLNLENLQKRLHGKLIRRIYGFKSEYYDTDAKVYVLGKITEGVKVTIVQKDHISAIPFSSSAPAPKSVTSVSGPGMPPQTTVTPPKPTPKVPEAGVILNAIGTAAGPAVVGLEGAQALLQKYFSNSSGTNASKPVSSTSK